MIKQSLLFLFFALQLFAQSEIDLSGVLSRLPNSSSDGIYIYDLDNNKPLFTHNHNKSMIPASNTKLFTTSAALYYLPYNDSVRTSIISSGFRDSDSLLDGDLFIKGFGDPFFKVQHLDSLVDVLYKSGLRHITGDIIGDDTYFDSLYTRDDWIVDERANVDLPPVAALSINRNEILARCYANKGYGSKIRVKILNDIGSVEVVNSATITSRRRRPQFELKIENEKLKLYVTGKMRKRRYPLTYSVHVHDPSLYAAVLLKRKLKEAGITVEGIADKGRVPFIGNSIASHVVSLKHYISVVNKNSDNYKAECLFKILGAVYGGEQGNSFYATQAVLSMIEELGVYEEGTAVVDGSGISRFNEITPSAVVGLLKAVYNNPEIYDAFYNSLSISGTDGTLKRRMRSKGLRGSFHGKTGTLRGVTALSGYLKTKSGRNLAICVIINYKRKGGSFHKNIEDKIVEEAYKL